jgi:hypothetical protein
MTTPLKSDAVLGYVPAMTKMSTRFRLFGLWTRCSDFKSAPTGSYITCCRHKSWCANSKPDRYDQPYLATIIMENTGVKRLAEEVVKTYREKAEGQVLIPWFSGLSDQNESILTDGDDTFCFVMHGSKQFTIKSTSPHPQFSVFHLQVLMWTATLTWSNKKLYLLALELYLLALEKQILSVVAAGGDCTLQAVDVQVLCNDSEYLSIVRATPREFILDRIKQDSKHYLTQGCINSDTCKILGIIEKSKCTVPFVGLALQSLTSTHTNGATFGIPVRDSKDDQSDLEQIESD